jgi:hypothetical protein
LLSLITLLQGIGLAYAAGLNLYATVAVTGLAVRLGWVQHVPTTIEPFANLFVIGLALAFYIIEFIATLIPGVASAWETLHGRSVLRRQQCWLRLRRGTLTPSSSSSPR